MKTIFCLFFASVAFTAHPQTNILLTNDVAIGNRNISFTIKNYSSANGEKEVLADDSLSWILRNPTDKDGKVHWEGMNHTFSLRLFDGQGNEMALTDDGKQMNSGPLPLPKTGSIHLMGLPPGGTKVMDFPALTNLFLFPKPGGYTFEARYWYIENGSHEQWKLSEPVRLKVIELPTESKSVVSTNGFSR